MSPLEKNMETSVLIKKGSLYAMTALFVTAIGASWGFTWTAAVDRTKLIETVNAHVSNQYIHNMDEKLVTQKELKLYFEAINIKLDNIAEDVEELKDK